MCEYARRRRDLLKENRVYGKEIVASVLIWLVKKS
jgi:hypothetical protein